MPKYQKGKIVLEFDHDPDDAELDKAFAAEESNDSKPQKSELGGFVDRFAPTAIGKSVLHDLGSMDIKDPTSIPGTPAYSFKKGYNYLKDVGSRAGGYLGRGVESYKQALEPGLDLDTRGQLVSEGGGRMAQGFLGLIPGVNPDTMENLVSGVPGSKGEALADITNVLLPKTGAVAKPTLRVAGKIASNPIAQAVGVGALEHSLFGGGFGAAGGTGAAFLHFRPAIRAAVRETVGQLKNLGGAAKERISTPKAVAPKSLSLKPEFQPTPEGLYPKASDVRLEHILDDVLNRTIEPESMPRASVDPSGNIAPSGPRLGPQPEGIYSGPKRVTPFEENPFDLTEEPLIEHWLGKQGIAEGNIPPTKAKVGQRGFGEPRTSPTMEERLKDIDLPPEEGKTLQKKMGRGISGGSQGLEDILPNTTPGGFKISHSEKSGTFGLKGPNGEKVGGRILPHRIEMTSIGKGNSANSESAIQALRELSKIHKKPVLFTSTNLSESGGKFRARMIERGDLIETPDGYLLKGTGRVGSRLSGENPRAQGTNLRNIGLNPRSPLLKNIMGEKD